MTVSNHFWVHWPLESPSTGPFSASKNVAPVRVWDTFSIWGRFAVMICNSFLLSPCFGSKNVIFNAFYHNFSSRFCKFYENVLPAFGGKHIFEERLLQISCARGCFHTQIGFKTTTYGRAFPPCAVQKIICFAE